MPRNIVDQQLASLKTHPHIKKVEKMSSRLIKLIYSPENSLEVQYKIKVQLPLNYPDEPPTVKFMDPIEHVNICQHTGLVHQPLLMEEWSPYLSLYIIVDILDTLMVEPERDPKYCVNQQCLSISEIRKNSSPKHSDQIGTQRTEFSRKLQRTYSKMADLHQIVNQDFVGDSPFDIEPVQPPRPKRGLKRWKSFRCEKPNDYLEIEAKAQEEEQKKPDKLNAHKLSLIFEEAEQNSKICEQVSEDAKKTPRMQNHRPKPIELALLTDSIHKNAVEEHLKPQSKIHKTPQTLRRIQRKMSNIFSPMQNMPALRRKTTIEEDILSNRTGIKTAQISPSSRFKELKNTTFFQNSSHQLEHINRLLGVFTKQYEQLLQRQKSTSNSRLLTLIDSKINEQVDMIMQLQQLASELKRQMLDKVKRQNKR